jgi:hypothetical protein
MTDRTNKAEGVYVTRYNHMAIYLTEDGYIARNGSDYAADNEETLEDTKAAIDQYWIDQSSRGGPCEYLGEPS